MRFCMIGCGEHAFSSHGPSQAAYARTHPAFLRAACCDRDLARAARYRERFSFGRAYDDIQAMLDAERPDAVAVAVPVAVACEVGRRVLEQGVPALLEKPPGETVAEIDSLIAASRGMSRDGGVVPHQVAFNRRYVPLVAALRRRLDALGSQRLLHVRYEMIRSRRLDPDFSTTAIHAIDAVRFIAGSDFAEARFRYQELRALGPGVANIFMEGVMRSGVTAHLSFCPVSGGVVERAEVHAHDASYFLDVPMWGGYDAPGRLLCLEGGRVVSDARGDRAEPFEQGGFYGEYEAFLDSLAAGRPPSPGLADVRQSVEVAAAMRARRSEFRA
jgi:predicted dehydrogenase